MGTRHRIYPPMLECAREMRHPQTAAEATLWRALRNRSQRYKFRRQHPIDRFIVDFYCAEAKLCIEVDGDSHAERAQAEYDAARTAFLEEVGYRVIRFTNNDVCYSIHAVVNEILSAIARILLPLSPTGRGLG
ncbi:MAG: endonuclease domain-containing protein [Chloroflexi bacterium]|nr:endonuclease domain-containing protein [Chloroflexota bacterium]